MTNADFYNAVKENLLSTLRSHAYQYYYQCDGRAQAKTLLTESLKIDPYCIKDIMYRFVFCLPNSVFIVLRRMKQVAFSFAGSALLKLKKIRDS